MELRRPREVRVVVERRKYHSTLAALTSLTLLVVEVVRRASLSSAAATALVARSKTCSQACSTAAVSLRLGARRPGTDLEYQVQIDFWTAVRGGVTKA